MKASIAIGLVPIAFLSAALLWQSQPSKRVLMTDEHPVVVDLQLPELDKAPLPPRRPKFAKNREPMVADKEGVDPRGEITPDFERGVCFMYQVAFGIGYVTIDGKQYDCR